MNTAEKEKATPASYRMLNRALLAVVLFSLAQAMLFLRFREHLPGFLTTCASIRILGRPCPLCGLTRGIHALSLGRLAEAQAWHPLSAPTFLLLACEVLYRVWASSRLMPEATRRRLVRADFNVHALLTASYAAYCVWFYLRPSGCP